MGTGHRTGAPSGTGNRQRNRTPGTAPGLPELHRAVAPGTAPELHRAPAPGTGHRAGSRPGTGAATGEPSLGHRHLAPSPRPPSRRDGASSGRQSPRGPDRCHGRRRPPVTPGPWDRARPPLPIPVPLLARGGDTASPVPGGTPVGLSRVISAPPHRGPRTRAAGAAAAPAPPGGTGGGPGSGGGRGAGVGPLPPVPRGGRKAAKAAESTLNIY